MKLHYIFSVLIAVFLNTTLKSQSGNKSALIDSFTNLGIAFHDDQKFSEAISSFERALKLDKNDPRANYELGNTLLTVGRFEDAIKHADRVLSKSTLYGDQAYTMKATAYDYLDQPQKAIKTYKEGIEKYPKDHMLPFNLSVTLLKTSAYQEAEMYALKAVSNKKTHPGSNLMLGYSNYYMGNKTETVLALYYFLMLENTTKRAKTAWSVADEVLKIGSKKEEKPKNEFNLNVNGRFLTADMSILAIQMIPDSILSKSMPARLSGFNKSFFEAIEVSEKAGTESVYNKIYVPFFKEMHKAGYTEIFTYWICNPLEETEASAYLKTNTEQLDAFLAWANEKLKKE